ncbi:low temperature requirement protein A [Halosolutus gelatinilyticus]|uniref:low temperature requirement protein A n=1 Tax=Halosolutus gelatinilyticus TaxID=2931975 RepID=UPI001FF17297|nr:low temperature requirement protein A [Halosolutus gelatinilyticus]
MSETRLRPPQLRTDGTTDDNRHATWLELFFDLVFVVAIAQLAHRLHDDHTLIGVLGFVALFVPVWWAWIGSTFYATRFDTDDVEYRLLTAVEMFGVIALAVNVHGGLGETSRGFALAYVLVRSVLVFKYFRAHRHLPDVRSLTAPMGIGYTIAALIWLVSVFVPTPYRFGLWGVAIAIDIATPILVRRQHIDIPVHPTHIPERFGLFTIIVLGETIVSVVAGISIQEWAPTTILMAICSTVIAFSLWWLYFDNYDESALRTAREEGRMGTYFAWIYVHFPFAIGITAIGVGVLGVFTGGLADPLPPTERWLLAGSLALCLLSLGLLHRTTLSCAGRRPIAGVQSIYRFGTAALVLVVGIGGWWIPPIGFIALLTIACLLQIGVGYGIRGPTSTPSWAD